MTLDYNKICAKQIKDWNLRIKELRLNNENKIKDTIMREIAHLDISAITVCFSDIEGRLHMLDYDKDFLIASHDNLTFDGSSIRGFTDQNESDLRLNLDWGACYRLTPELFGDKLYIFAEIRDKDNNSYSSDIRGILANKLTELKSQNIRVNVAAEIEGFLFKGIDVEKTFKTCQGFIPITTGGYFNTLPKSPLRQFIDSVAATQRVAGFENEKDHPEVAPSQFEINWSYTEAIVAADQIQLYKMICRQIANLMGYTASFLPKPMVGINGSGMHTNISLEREGKNIFFGKNKNGLSDMAWDFVSGVLSHGQEICLALNPSVNAYRRLDPAYEAPNEIKASSIDRGSMIRIPIGNEKSARIEVRTIAPDANPYLVILSILEAGLSNNADQKININPSAAFLPININSAIQHFQKSQLMKTALGEGTHAKYINWKQEAADRCPQKLGISIKRNEVIYHHEITNQQLWSKF